jgi:hypothetical protein
MSGSGRKPVGADESKEAAEGNYSYKVLVRHAPGDVGYIKPNEKRNEEDSKYVNNPNLTARGNRLLELFEHPGFYFIGRTEGNRIMEEYNQKHGRDLGPSPCIMRPSKSESDNDMYFTLESIDADSQVIKSRVLILSEGEGRYKFELGNNTYVSLNALLQSRFEPLDYNTLKDYKITQYTPPRDTLEFITDFGSSALKNKAQGVYAGKAEAKVVNTPSGYVGTRGVTPGEGVTNFSSFQRAAAERIASAKKSAASSSSSAASNSHSVEGEYHPREGYQGRVEVQPKMPDNQKAGGEEKSPSNQSRCLGGR